MSPTASRTPTAGTNRISGNRSSASPSAVCLPHSIWFSAPDTPSGITSRPSVPLVPGSTVQVTFVRPRSSEGFGGTWVVRTVDASAVADQHAPYHFPGMANHDGTATLCVVPSTGIVAAPDGVRITGGTEHRIQTGIPHSVSIVPSGQQRLHGAWIPIVTAEGSTVVASSGMGRGEAFDAATVAMADSSDE